MSELEEYVKSEARELVAKEKNEQAKTAIGLQAMQRAAEDDVLMSSMTEAKKKGLIHSANADLKREEAESKKADTELQKADYDVYNGVAAYAGIKKPLPSKMQKILFTVLSALQTIYLLAFGFPISIINITADGVNSVVEKLAALTKSARWIVLLMIIIGVGFFIVYVVKFFLAKLGAIG